MTNDKCQVTKECPKPTVQIPGSKRIGDEGTSLEQFEIFRRMTPGRRLELAEQLYWSARTWKAGWLRSLHSDWSEEQVAHEVTCIFQNART
jgi:hypothetical protein